MTSTKYSRKSQPQLSRPAPIIVRLRDGTSLFTNVPVAQFTDRLLNARYNGTQFTVNDIPVPLSEIAQVEWPRKDPEND